MDNLREIVGYGLGSLGAALMVASYLMKSMLPLRIVALLACLFLLAYGAILQAWVPMGLYTLLVGINIKKTLQIRQLVRAIESARADSPLAEWLLPHMKPRQLKAGDWLWRQGDEATEMLYLESGELELVERGERLGPGSLIGEIGLFSPDRRRTLSLRCASDCRLYALSSEAMQQLYFESPKLGFHVMRLVVARLMHDVHLVQPEERAAPAS